MSDKTLQNNRHKHTKSEQVLIFRSSQKRKDSTRTDQTTSEKQKQTESKSIVIVIVVMSIVGGILYWRHSGFEEDVIRHLHKLPRK